MSTPTPAATGDPAIRESAGDVITTGAGPASMGRANSASVATYEYNPPKTYKGPSVVFVEPWGVRHSAWIILRQRNFLFYFSGALVSNLGTWFQSTVQILIAYQVTHSVFTVGLITSAQFAGMVIISPWAAVVADLVGTKMLLIGSQCVSAVVALYMAWRYHTGLLGVHTLVFGALALGVAYALALPVQTALVPQLTDSKDAASAVKLNSVSYNAGRALAPALCVLVIALIGREFIFFLNAVSFLIFAGCLAVALSDQTPASGKISNIARKTTGQAGPHRRARVTDGILIALLQPRILLLLAIVAAVTLADDPVLVLSPALAQARLHLSSDWTGYFIAALGWGSVLGSLPPTSTRVCSPKSASRRAAISLLILALSVFVFTLGLWTPLSLLAAVIAGGAGLFTGSAAQTALLRHQTDQSASLASVAGVAALWAIAWAGTKPFASLFDGWLASQKGILFTTIVLILPALAIAVCEIELSEPVKETIRCRGSQLTKQLIPILAKHSRGVRESLRLDQAANPADEIVL